MRKLDTVLKIKQNDNPLILIGGLAIFLHFLNHNKLPLQEPEKVSFRKIKDIDFIVDYEILDKLKKNYTVFHNRKMKMYELLLDDTKLNAFGAFDNMLNLSLQFQKNAVELFGIKVASIPDLILMKEQTVKDRPNSTKNKADLDLLKKMIKK